jgi:hypothetical protein
MPGAMLKVLSSRPRFTTNNIASAPARMALLVRYRYDE